MLRLNHTHTHFNPEQVWRRADFEANVAAIVDDGKARANGVIKPYAPRAEGNLTKSKEKYLLPENVGASEAVSLLEAQMMAGTSFVLAFEKVSAARRPMKWLADALFAVTGVALPLHCRYITVTLPLHCR